jgi:hypothetical protein
MRRYEDTSKKRLARSLSIYRAPILLICNMHMYMYIVCMYVSMYVWTRWLSFGSRRGWSACRYGFLTVTSSQVATIDFLLAAFFLLICSMYMYVYVHVCYTCIYVSLAILVRFLPFCLLFLK